MKKAKPPGNQKGAPPSHRLLPGEYLYWQRQIYRIVELHYETVLQVLAETIPEATRVPLSLLDLFSQSGEQKETLLVASSLEALTRQMEERYAASTEKGAVLAHDIPDAFVLKARLITFIVESVQRLVNEEERRAQALHEAFSQTQAVLRALVTCNGSRVQMSLHDQKVEQIIQPATTNICVSTRSIREMKHRLLPPSIAQPFDALS